ncbi:hypothetical protein DV515_00012554 [Chloebia gouldiae]|uniref:Uncharacterized protein n=1 Tax=Chloebia gouldiae TaxID=44316 RepID=A0A3L8S3Q3_CHLGU|nr:hypothetical protein DV515_00012554 [Chloebia gouldiae]
MREGQGMSSFFPSPTVRNKIQCPIPKNRRNKAQHSLPEKGGDVQKKLHETSELCEEIHLSLTGRAN